MRVLIEPNYELVSKWTANYVAMSINKFGPSKSKPFVLGLPTGSSPLGTYKELIQLNKKGVVSFKHVVTFNMDEYVGIPQDHPESYHSFMWNNLFKHIDIQEKNVNILDGNAPDLEAECAGYEERMKQAGGINLFLGGIGPDILHSMSLARRCRRERASRHSRMIRSWLIHASLAATSTKCPRPL